MASDEVVINIAGRKHWLWRAVDQHGGMAPPVMITDKLVSYAAAKREVMPGVEHR